MSLRSRLTILFALVAFVASVLVGGISYRGTARELDASTDRFLETRLDETVGSVNDVRFDGVGRDRPVRPGRVFNGRPIANDDSIAQVVGLEGNAISSSVELPVTEGAAQLVDAPTGDSRSRASRSSATLFEDIVVEDESYRMASRATDDGVLVQVARSTDETDELLRTLIGRFFVITRTVAAIAAAVGWFIATTTTAPLRRLSRVAGDVAVTRDFTTDVGETERNDEIGQLAASFASMLDALETSREQQHRLIHDAGHELRTPLTSLRANVALLERARDLPEQDRTEVLAAIRSELVELGALFDEMIDLATDRSDGSAARQPIDLAAVVDAVAGRWQNRTGRPFAVEVESSIVDADPAMIERAINNLVSNADKFSDAGLPIRVTSSDGAVSVIDRGPGIPEADRERIFDRFHRSESTRSMPGSGLGLSIVAQAVELHGGTVWARDADGGGSDVGFRLPLSDAALDHDER
jgi:two-component system sensor histidine kinase MprB